jgi:hypothetical protein
MPILSMRPIVPINLAIGSQVIGTISVSRTPSVGEMIVVHPQDSEQRRSFLVRTVIHFPVNPQNAATVDAECQVVELPSS